MYRTFYTEVSIIKCRIATASNTKSGKKAIFRQPETGRCQKRVALNELFNYPKSLASDTKGNIQVIKGICCHQLFLTQQSFDIFFKANMAKKQASNTNKDSQNDMKLQFSQLFLCFFFYT